MKIFRFLAAASVALASLVAFSSESSARTTSKDLYKQFQNPDSRYRPFVRWWWNGDRVEAEELVRELHILKDARESVEWRSIRSRSRTELTRWTPSRSNG